MRRSGIFSLLDLVLKFWDLDDRSEGIVDGLSVRTGVRRGSTNKEESRLQEGAKGGQKVSRIHIALLSGFVPFRCPGLTVEQTTGSGVK